MLFHSDKTKDNLVAAMPRYVLSVPYVLSLKKPRRRCSPRGVTTFTDRELFTRFNHNDHGGHAQANQQPVTQHAAGQV